jgi:hypothetical protein
MALELSTIGLGWTMATSPFTLAACAEMLCTHLRMAERVRRIDALDDWLQGMRGFAVPVTRRARGGRGSAA